MVFQKVRFSKLLNTNYDDIIDKDEPLSLFLIASCNQIETPTPSAELEIVSNVPEKSINEEAGYAFGNFCFHF